MLKAVDRLKNAIVACGTVSSAEITNYLMNAHAEHKAAIIAILARDSRFAVEEDETLSVSVEQRLHLSGIAYVAEYYAGIERVYLRICESMYKGIEQTYLFELGGLDRKQISRFVVLLRSLGLIVQTQKRWLYATFVVQNEELPFLEQFSLCQNTKNCLEDFSTYFSELYLAKNVIQGYLSRNNEGRLGSELVQLVWQVHPTLRYGKEVINMVDGLEQAGYLDHIIVQRRHFCVLGKNAKIPIYAQYKPFTPFYTLPYVPNGHFTDSLFAATISRPYQLGSIIYQYLSHDYFKIARQMLKVLTAIYPFGIDKQYNIQFKGFNSVPENLGQYLIYGYAIAQLSYHPEYEDEEIEEQEQKAGDQPNELFYVIYYGFQSNNIQISTYRTIRCYNVYLIIESLTVVSEMLLYHVHQVQITNSGNFTVLCVKYHNSIVEDLIYIGAIKKYQYNSQTYYALSTTEVTQQMLEYASYNTSTQLMAEESDGNYDNCVDVNYYIVDNAKRIGFFIQTIYNILYTTPRLTKLFNSLMFTAEHIVQFFTVRQLLSCLYLYQKLYEYQIKYIVELNMLDSRLCDLPNSVAYYFFGTCQSFNMIVARFNSYLRQSARLCVVKQILVEEAVIPEVFMILKERQKKKAAFCLTNSYVYNVEQQAPIIFVGNNVHPMFSGLTYLRTNIPTYCAEIVIDQKDNYMLIFRVIRDFINRVKCVAKEMRCQDFVYFERGRDLDYCLDYVIDAHYDGIMKQFNQFEKPSERTVFDAQQFSQIRKCLTENAVDVRALHAKTEATYSLEQFACMLVASLQQHNLMYNYVLLIDNKRIYPFKLYSMKPMRKKPSRGAKSRSDAQLAKEGSQTSTEQLNQQKQRIKHYKPTILTAKYYPHMCAVTPYLYSDFFRQMEKHCARKRGSWYRCRGLCYYQDVCSIAPFKPLFQMYSASHRRTTVIFEKVCQYYQSGTEVHDVDALAYAQAFDLTSDNKVTRIFNEVEDLQCSVPYNDEREMYKERTAVEIKSLMNALIMGRVQYHEGKFSDVQTGEISITYAEPGVFNDIPYPHAPDGNAEDSILSLLEDTNKAQASEYDGLLESSQRDVSDNVDRRSRLNLADFLKGSVTVKATEAEAPPHEPQRVSQEALKDNEFTSKIMQLYPDPQIYKETNSERIALFANLKNFSYQIDDSHRLRRLAWLRNKNDVEISKLPNNFPKGCFYQNWGWSGMTYGNQQNGYIAPLFLITSLCENIVRFLRIKNCTQVKNLIQIFVSLPPSCVLMCLNILVLDQQIALRKLGGRASPFICGGDGELDYIVEILD